MAHASKISFEFKNQVAPRYVEVLFLPLEQDRWYSSHELKELLRSTDQELDGSNIVNNNIQTWSLIGLVKAKRQKAGRSQSVYLQINPIAKQLQEYYSTNPPLFFDLMHFLFYSSYYRFQNPRWGRFWLYARACELWWERSPEYMDSYAITNKLQQESNENFAELNPSFPEKSVRGIYTWLRALNPPFLIQPGTKSQLKSERREYCTPQLFHLATDLVYHYSSFEGLAYGTSLAIGEAQIEKICRICLLDTSKFWEMADLTRMSLSGFDVRHGQWGTSIALDSAPTWIKLPTFEEVMITEQQEELDLGGEE